MLGLIRIAASCINAAIRNPNGLPGLHCTQCQIEQNSRVVKASSIYAAAKDGRELAEKVAKKEVGDGHIINFIHALYHQKRLGMFDDTVWKPIETEICGFLKGSPTFKNYWTVERRSMFTDDFVEYLTKQWNRQECKP